MRLPLCPLCVPDWVADPDPDRPDWPLCVPDCVAELDPDPDRPDWPDDVPDWVDDDVPDWVDDVPDWVDDVPDWLEVCAIVKLAQSTIIREVFLSRIKVLSYCVVFLLVGGKLDSNYRRLLRSNLF